MARHAPGRSVSAKDPPVGAGPAVAVAAEVDGQRRRWGRLRRIRDGCGHDGRRAQNEAEHGGEEGAG